MRAYLIVATCLLPSLLSAQEKDLASMSLEDFLNVEVTSVSKSKQKLSRSPAAVFVITQDDILRSGASNVPDALRLAPGVHVARINGTTWAIGIRGFNSIFSNKLLVMIDGRAIYSALYSGVMWNEQMLMMEDIERIEVIRGPGATMWGANAVSGVINIITKSATATLGGIGAVSAGTSDRVRARARYGAKIGENAAWRAWGQYSLLGQTTEPGMSTRPDPWRSGRGGMRLDWKASENDSVLVEAEVLTTGIPEVGISNTGNTAGSVLGRWNHLSGKGSEETLQFFVNDEAADAGYLTMRVRTIDLDFQHSMALNARHKLTAGVGMRSNGIRTVGTPGFHFDPANRMYGVFNAFIQDEWELKPDKVTASFGGKLEHYSLAGLTFQPMVRLMWTPKPGQGYWISASQAIRVPAHSDYAVRIAIPISAGDPTPTQLDLTGSDQFQPEKLKALEAGVRLQPGRRIAFDMAVFHHWYTGLRGYQLALANVHLGSSPDGSAPTLIIPAIATNGMDGVNQGVEVAVHYDVRPNVQLSGSYSSLFAGTTLHSGLSSFNFLAAPAYTPEHQWQVRGDWDFARNWTSELAFYRIGEFPGKALNAFSRLDCRLARRWGEFTELSVSGQNLLRPRQQEFAGRLIIDSEAVSRHIEVSIRWSF